LVRPWVCKYPYKLSFFDKEYTLISSRYQLHLASATTQYPSGNTDAHNPNKKKIYSKKEKSSYSDKFLVAATLTPPRQH
jgi:hypothetical protein